MAGDLCLIPDSEPFTLGEKIGTGSFATVYKALDKNTHTMIAIKSYRLKVKERSYFERAATEIAFLKLLEHPNIISYICSDIKKYYMYLGIEYSKYGCLTKYMEKRDNLSEQSVQIIMRQLLSAICYLHSKNIFHGDIKPENIILIEEEGLKIKLTDFGLAEVIMKNQTIQKKSGSFFYMSPEIHLGFPADYKSDLFSAGVLMYEMLYGDKPYPTKISKEEYISLLRKRIYVKFPEAQSILLTPDCLNLLRNLISYDKDKRLSGVNLLNHPFLKVDVVKDEQNHYFKAYECFLNGVDLIKEKKYGTGYIAVIEAILHLQIHSIEIEEVGLYRYILMKLREFTKFSEKILDKVINNGSMESLDMHSDTERLRCLLQSSPELLTAYDLCVVGEMYFMQNDLQRGTDLLKNGLQILLNKMPHEPEGLRRKLLGAKMTKWMNILEDCNQGPSQYRS
ncbi:serine/threonine-protein kinase ULK3-like [Anoplophora glabripennis]|uniref:serine/threonine-protein kinase ULK3-like n=1 Tax=Anoplophora glabripennis TaxID=217634 RepID=UPI0008749594|nr:serine/threonine-protein kinase ULK3-like [Anoplophora glabripennis]